MCEVYFQQIPEMLEQALAQAQSSIRVAVCWFSHRGIFNALLDRIGAGVVVELLIEYDTRNICNEGLNFQFFVESGGQLLASRDTGLLHHKFAILDDRILLTGSFNWTYNANAENVIVTDEVELVAAFLDEFHRRKNEAQEVFQINQVLPKSFTPNLLFEKSQHTLNDLRKKVSVGTNVWVVGIPNKKMNVAEFLFANQMPFDHTRLLDQYWSVYRIWDEALFSIEMDQLGANCAARQIRMLRCWMQRIKTGDILFLTEKSSKYAAKQLIGIGVVQSDPKPMHGSEFSTFREVHWLKNLEKSPYQIPVKWSVLLPAKYRGSVFKVLHETMG